MADDGEPSEPFQVDGVYRGHEDMNNNGIPDYQDERAADTSTVFGQGPDSVHHEEEKPDRSHEYGPEFDANEPYSRSQTEAYGVIAAGPDLSDAEYDPTSRRASESANATASRIEQETAGKTPLKEAQKTYASKSASIQARRLQSDAKKQRSTLFGEMMAQKPHRDNNHNGTEVAHEVLKGIIAGMSHDRKQAAIKAEAKAEKLRRAEEDLQLAEGAKSLADLQEASRAAAAERDGTHAPEPGAAPAGATEEKTVEQTIRRGSEGPEGPEGGSGGPGGNGGPGGGVDVLRTAEIAGDASRLPANDRDHDQAAARAAELGAAEAGKAPAAVARGENEIAADASVKARAAELGRGEAGADKAALPGATAQPGAKAPEAGKGAEIDPAATSGKVVAGAAANVVAPGVGAAATAASLRADQVKAGTAHQTSGARQPSAAPERARAAASPSGPSAGSQGAPRRLASPQRRETQPARMGGLRAQAASLPAPASPSGRALPRGVPTPSPAPRPAGLGLSLASMVAAAKSRPENDMSYRPDMIDMKKRSDDMGRGR